MPNVRSNSANTERAEEVGDSAKKSAARIEGVKTRELRLPPASLGGEKGASLHKCASTVHRLVSGASGPEI
eukprot:3316339-Rhodomonas_salina.1